MVTLDAQAKGKRSGTVSHAALSVAPAVALASVIFAFDVSLPLGVAGGVPYVALVLLGLWLPWRHAVLVLALIATVLTLAGYVLSPAGGFEWMALSNRALAIFAIWVAAGLAFERRRSDDALKEAQNELERRVDVRTAELRDANEALAREVVERRRAETTLRTSETRLRRAQRMAMLGHWEWYPRANYLHLSPEVGLILGVAPEDLPVHNSQFCEMFVHSDDQAHYIAATRQTLESAYEYKLEYRIVRPDGEARWILELSEITYDEFNRRVGMSGTIQDITERKQAEATIREWGMQLAHAQRLAKLGHWSWNNTKRGLVDCSEESTRIFGVPRAEFPKTFEEWCGFVHPDDCERAAQTFTESHKSGTGYEIEYRIVRPDGETRYVAEIAEQEKDAVTGDMIASGTIQDVTERKLAEEALGASEQRLRAIIENAPVSIAFKDRAGRHNLFGALSCALFGVSSEEANGKTSHEFLPKKLADSLVAQDRRVFETGLACEREYEVILDGVARTILTVKFPVPDATGAVAGIGAISRDITERKRAEKALYQARDELEARVVKRTAELLRVNERLVSEIAERERTQRALVAKSRLLDAFFEHSRVVVSISDSEGRYLVVNPEFERVFGVSGDEVKGKTVFDVFPTDIAESLRAQEERVVSGKRAEFREDSVPHTDGTSHAYLTAKFPVLDASGEPIAFGTIGTDITERKRAAESLRASQARLRSAQRMAGLAYWDWRREDRTSDMSAEMATIFGVQRDQLRLNDEEYIEKFVHPDDRERVARVYGLTDDKPRRYEIEYRIIRADGVVRNIHEAGESAFDETGQVIGMSGTTQDITERKRLEQQLDQAAKLATLGEMAAGIAHELNQPLHIIRMSADSSLLLMEEGQANIKDHDEQFQLISSQAQRMAEIIDHMRIFGRVDDEEPTRFDPVECVTGAINMVADQYRVEDIGISVKMPRRHRAVLGRPVRLEQVMLNLLNNARDAILSNAERSAKARRAKRTVDIVVSPDDRSRVVRISVTDSGGGIPQHVLGHVFEPFFTTKEVGTGTGLGLSISYGIIAEMGGTIEARNIRNKARFEISLPICSDA